MELSQGGTNETRASHYIAWTRTITGKIPVVSEAQIYEEHAKKSKSGRAWLEPNRVAGYMLPVFALFALIGMPHPPLHCFYFINLFPLISTDR